MTILLHNYVFLFEMHNFKRKVHLNILNQYFQLTLQANNCMKFLRKMSVNQISGKQDQ